MEKVYNFSAGPAMLSPEVMAYARDEFLNYDDSGMSIMEMSHRSPRFQEIAQEAEQNLRQLLFIPQHYKILFLQGGGQSQFSMVPMNLIDGKGKAAYVKFGHWGNLAINEAKKYADVKVVADTSATGFNHILGQEDWLGYADCSYLYVVDNETVNGVEFNFTPKITGVPLVSDMSSNILSKQFNITDYGLVFAAAQKNLGPAGVTIVIIREDLLERTGISPLPRMFDYRQHVAKSSMLNTPATYSWYMVALVLRWMKEQGGLDYFDALNARKAKKLYDFLDSQDFFINTIDPDSRSRMNVVFHLAHDNLNDSFLSRASERGLVNLRGHRSVGGMRASIYNSMPEEGVDLLIDYMREFSMAKG
jgi:phosphoserine aminotransferase